MSIYTKKGDRKMKVLVLGDNIIPTSGVVLFEGKLVLLVNHQNKAGHVTGSYGLPAGRIKNIETKEQCAVRELREETGLRVQPNDLVELPTGYTAEIKRSDGTTKIYSLTIFLVERWTGQLTSSGETIPEWVDMDRIKKIGEEGRLLPNVEAAIKEGRRFRKGTSRKQ